MIDQHEMIRRWNDWFGIRAMDHPNVAWIKGGEMFRCEFIAHKLRQYERCAEYFGDRFQTLLMCK